MTQLPYFLPTTLPGGEDETFIPLAGDILYLESYCEDSKNLLTQEYKGKPRIEGFLCALGEQAQLLENAFYQLLTLRSLSTATGVNLDRLGDIVGEKRRDRLDDVYRVYIGIRILVNSSDGKVEQILSIMRAAFGNMAGFYIFENAPMSVQVFLPTDIGDILPLDFTLYLRLAKDATVRLDFIWTVAAESATFFFNDSDSGQCIGSTTDASLGGKMGGVSK